MTHLEQLQEIQRQLVSIKILSDVTRVNNYLTDLIEQEQQTAPAHPNYILDADFNDD